MRRPLFLVILCGLARLALGEPGSAHPPDTRTEAERIADKLRFFATRDFLYDRSNIHFLPLDSIKDYFVLLAPVTDERHSVEAWVALLKHPNARVRTVALAALFAKEDAKLLPHIASLMNDEALTFPLYDPPLNPTFFVAQFEPKFLKKQTVAKVAGAMIGFYLWRVGYDLHERPPTLAEFKEYWDVRKHRTHCASWFTVRLERASEGQSPIAQSRLHRVHAIRKEIDKLPSVERSWVMLWQFDQSVWQERISNDDLVAAAKKLGPDRLLSLLRRNAATDDPDWEYPQKRGTVKFTSATRLILGNAGKLLRPQDGATLLAYEAAERESAKRGNSTPNLGPHWTIGTAQLLPDEAKELLLEAYSRHLTRQHEGTRAQLATELWRARGPAEIRCLVDLFYNEEPQLGEFGNCRVLFLRMVHGVRSPHDRKLFAAIVRDRRFETIDWNSLKCLVEMANGWTKKPILEQNELNNTLQEWRTAVRASVEVWSPLKGR